MIQERKHRLPLESYRGRVAVAFTACLRMPSSVVLDDESWVVIRTKLLEEAGKYDSNVLAWCLMPDHLHVILHGHTESADTWRAMVAFKQQTGFWLARHRPAISWQKDFFDHIIRSEESLETQVLYAVNNPVRAGMVQEWWQYPDTDGTMVDEMRVRIGRGGAGWSLRLPITQW